MPAPATAAFYGATVSLHQLVAGGMLDVDQITALLEAAGRAVCGLGRLRSSRQVRPLAPFSTMNSPTRQLARAGARAARLGRCPEQQAGVLGPYWPI
jgi:hypothetical protein